MRVLPLIVLATAAAVSTAQAIEMPHQTFTLDNGLRVVVHTDRKAPVVAVNIWYHVGSKDEQPGKTGFAHLFEHLMFQGTEHYDDEFFKPLEQVGATSMNGTTSFDRTNYFFNVPTTALDLGLWMASEQMGHFLGAVDQARLDEQRGVVKNEKRQGENQPYGQAYEALFRASFPAGHPYHHMPIGSMADLDAATLDDVHWWFRSGYGPNNAVLVLAGDIDLDTAREKVGRYFGHIPAGPTLAQPPVDIAARTTSSREQLADRVAQPRIYRSWNIPQYGSPDLVHIQLLGRILGGSASSRLDRRLVHEEQLADRVSAFAMGMQLAGIGMVSVDVKAGVEPERVEAILDEELARLLTDGVSQQELDRARTMIRSGLVFQLERVGGFGGKADLLAECAVFAGDPACYQAELEVLDRATPQALLEAGRRWLAQGDHTLLVVPGERAPQADDQPTAAHVDPPPLAPADERFSHGPARVDRSAGPPVTDTFPDLAFPDLERARLDNGLQVILARRTGLPLVQMGLELGGGFSADAGRKLGTSSFTMAMLSEGAGELGALEFAAAVEALGGSITAHAALDHASIQLATLKTQLEPLMALFADVVLRPRFEPAEIERVRAQWLAGIAQEKSRPQSLAFRLLPPLIYGADHAYGIPFTGSGTEESVAALRREDLLAFHRDWVRPDNATLVAVGDITMAELTTLLGNHLGDWQAPEAALAMPDRHTVALPDGQRVFLVDQPGASQANILLGHLLPPTTDEHSLAFDLANDVFGGTFTSRLNMNLREDKGWSYGAHGSAGNAIGQRPWLAYAPVQIDRTADAISEIVSELGAFVADRPASAEEIDKVRNFRIRRLPGAYETGSAVRAAIAANIRYDRPDDYIVTSRQRIEAITDARIRAAAQRLRPDALTWVVVGDLAQIEGPVRALQLGPVQILDSDGRAVDRPAPEGADADADDAGDTDGPGAATGAEEAGAGDDAPAPDQGGAQVDPEPVPPAVADNDRP